MKDLFTAASSLLALLLALPFATRAQTGGVGIGTTAPDASAALEIKSTTQGLLPPRLTLAQRTALGTGSIAAPVAGLVIYQTDSTPGLYAYDGTAWVRLGGGDNLGNHTATQALNLGANALVGNGGTTGLTIGSAGDVAVAGTMQVPAAKAYTYAASKAYAITYGPNDFQPASASASNDKLLNTSGPGGSDESMYVGATSGSLRPPLHLPQGAMLTSLVLYYQDYNNGGSFGVGLALVANRMPYGSSQTLTSFASTNRPGIAQATIPAGTNIDNTANTYSLRATFGSVSPAVTIYGVTVNYTVTQAE